VPHRSWAADASRDACPWNVRFARALPEDSSYAAREALAIDVEGCRAAFRGSLMERAKLPAMRRNAAPGARGVGST
jgi:epoxyqueuosine reductase